MRQSILQIFVVVLAIFLVFHFPGVDARPANKKATNPKKLFANDTILAEKITVEGARAIISAGIDGMVFIGSTFGSHNVFTITGRGVDFYFEQCVFNGPVTFSVDDGSVMTFVNTVFMSTVTVIWHGTGVLKFVQGITGKGLLEGVRVNTLNGYEYGFGHFYKD